MIPLQMIRQAGFVAVLSRVAFSLVKMEQGNMEHLLMIYTFSDIPIYDCDFLELGVSDLLPGGPSRHGNDTGCQCQCVQKGCGWTGSEISNNMLDDRRRSVAIGLQSLMFGDLKREQRVGLSLKTWTCNAEGKAVQTISWLQSQMPYSRR